MAQDHFLLVDGNIGRKPLALFVGPGGEQIHNVLDAIRDFKWLSFDFQIADINELAPNGEKHLVPERSKPVRYPAISGRSEGRAMTDDAA